MAAIDLKDIEHIHMVGIGGVGMSGLANVLIDSGIRITGSDLKNNRLIGKLRKKGCEVALGHGNVKGDPNILVRSFSVKDDNPEVIEARKKGIPVIERSELLKGVIESKARSVSVAGTHGKTTTTAMISYILDRAGLDPTVLIGGEHEHFKGNSKSGKSDIIVAETDESDGFIENIKVRNSVITNLEKDHMEHYKKMSNLINAFKRFISNVEPEGLICYNHGDRRLQGLSSSFSGRKITYGFSQGADYRISSCRTNKLKTAFEINRHGKRLGNVVLNIPGAQNASNACAAISICMDFGIPFREIRSIIKDFKSVKRRFEIKYKKNGVLLVEDYAHHPTEIQTVVKVAAGLGKKRIVAVFQPHRYSRTQYLKDGFIKGFEGIDELILTDIYAASEKPIDGVGIEDIEKGLRKMGFKNVTIVPKGMIPGHFSKITRRGDVLLILGAGDVNELVPDIVKNIDV